MTRALKEEWIGERGRPKASLADVCTGYCAPLWKPHPTSKPSLAAAAAARVLYSQRYSVATRSRHSPEGSQRKRTTTRTQSKRKEFRSEAENK